MLKRIAIIVLFVTSAAEARQRKPPPCTNRATSDCEAPRPLTKLRTPPVKTITIGDPLALGGTLHGMSLLYFIERANEELERSTLPTKSFVPRIVQSVEEEAL